MGGAAALEYRDRARFTEDLDFLVRWHGDLLDELTADGWDINVHSDDGKVFLVRAARDDGLVDILIEEVPFQTQALERSRDHVVSAEDMIVFKLIAWRPRDRDDIESILANAPVATHLDLAYIDRWAAEWEVAERWESIRPKK
jgi:hypothetical protein